MDVVYSVCVCVCAVCVHVSLPLSVCLWGVHVSESSYSLCICRGTLDVHGGNITHVACCVTSVCVSTLTCALSQFSALCIHTQCHCTCTPPTELLMTVKMLRPGLQCTWPVQWQVLGLAMPVFTCAMGCPTPSLVRSRASLLRATARRSL